MGMFNSVLFTQGNTKIMVMAPHASRNIVPQTELSSVTTARRVSLLGVVKIGADMMPLDLIYF
jgi:hypothetical protein